MTILKDREDCFFIAFIKVVLDRIKQHWSVVSVIRASDQTNENNIIAMSSSFALPVLLVKVPSVDPPPCA